MYLRSPNLLSDLTINCVSLKIKYIPLSAFLPLPLQKREREYSDGLGLPPARPRTPLCPAPEEINQSAKTGPRIAGTTGTSALEYLMQDKVTYTASAPMTLKNTHETVMDPESLAVYAPNTRRIYASAWRTFLRWSEARGRPHHLPVSTADLLDYLHHLTALGRRWSTLQTHKSAVIKAHHRAGLPNPADNEPFREAMRGIGRTVGKRQTQVQALTDTAAAAISATAPTPRTAPGGRPETPERAARRAAADVALVAVMRDALLRSAEVSQLRWEDVELHEDGTGRVLVRQSQDRPGRRGHPAVPQPLLRSVPHQAPRAPTLPHQTDPRLRPLRLPDPPPHPDRHRRRGTPGKLRRPQPPHRHGRRPGPVRHRAPRDPAGRTMEVAQDARPLHPWHNRRARRRRPIPLGPQQLTPRPGPNTPNDEEKSRNRRRAVSRYTLPTPPRKESTRP